MSYKKMQAEKGLQFTITLPHLRPRRSVIRRILGYLLFLSILAVYIFTPVGHLATPFFATYFCYYPITSFNAAEMASLTTEFYELLSRMGQFPGEIIKYSPHIDPSINVTLAQSLGVAPQVIDLLQRLPYLEGYGGDGEEWVYSGAFADFRDDEQLLQSRDPFYAEPEGQSFYSERGPYMRPWQMALNLLGNHGAVMLLDTWTNRIVVKDQECACSVDEWINNIDYKDSWSKNENAWEHLPGRRAQDVLRDFMGKFERLEWIPNYFGLSAEAEMVRNLYIAHGWPNDFNLTAFEAAKEHMWDHMQALRQKEEPLRRVRMLDQYIYTMERTILQIQLHKLDLQSGRSVEPLIISGHVLDLKNVDDIHQSQQQTLDAARIDLRAAEETMVVAGLSRDSIAPDVEEMAMVGADGGGGGGEG